MEQKENAKIIRVKGSSSVPLVAGSIVKSIADNSYSAIEVRAIGASAVNQMYKALASARSKIATTGRDLYIRPGFDTIIEEGQSRTVVIATIHVM